MHVMEWTDSVTVCHHIASVILEICIIREPATILLTRCSGKIYPAVKNYPPPMTLPSVLSAVCIAKN